MPYTIKKGDTYPPLTINVTEDGDPIDLTAADAVKIILKTTAGTALTFTATITNAMGGVIQYAWQAGDTAIVGSYNAEVEIEWAAGQYQTVPNDSYDSVTIMQDLGGSV